MELWPDLMTTWSPSKRGMNVYSTLTFLGILRGGVHS